MNKVYITGVGCITPLGNNVETLWNNVINGVCGIGYITKLDRETLPIKIAAEVKDFKPEDFGIDKTMIRHNDTFALYALAAAAQAMQDSGLRVGEDVDPTRFGTAIGSGIGGIQTFEREHANKLQNGLRRISPLFIPEMISNIAGGNVAITYNAQGPNIPVVTACATGTHSVGEAYRLIHEGRADAVITGGTEAAICEMAVGGFNNMKALSTSEDPMAGSLPFDARRKGFVLGEGSGILILESEECAKRRGAKIYAEVCGYGNTCDAHHYTAPHPECRGGAQSMRLALEEAGFKADEKLYINAHGTGTPLNDKGETKGIKAALGEEGARKAVISSNGIIPPTIHLDQPDPECDLDYTPHTARQWQADVAISNTFGFGGNNATVALRRV